MHSCRFPLLYLVPLTCHQSTTYFLLFGHSGDLCCHNLGYGPVMAVPVIRLIVYRLRSHAFPFQGLPWKGWVFGSASSCPLRLLGPGHGIRSFGCHPSRKFFLCVEFIATLFPATVQMLAFSRQSKEEDSQSFHLVLARLQVMVLGGNAATDASTFLKILGSLTL